MKARRLHRIPLSDHAMHLLSQREAFSYGTNLVFSSGGQRKLSDMTLTKVLRDQKIASDQPGRAATAHGFRATFRDWASENDYPRDLAERALAHMINNETEAAYHRTDLWERRREMMQNWAHYVCQNLTH